MDISPPGTSVFGISQARILEWVAISFSRGLPHPGIGPPSPALQVDSFLLSLHTVGSAVYKQKKEDQGKDGTAKEDAVTWMILCS